MAEQQQQQQSIFIDVQFQADDVAKRLSEVTSSIADLKREQKELTAEIEKGNDADGEKAKQLVAVQKEVKQLTAEQKSLTGQLQTTLSANEDLGTSFREMDAQLRQMENEYKSLTKAQRETAQGQELKNAIIQQKQALKDFDAELGNHQRNVGNYSGSIIDAFGKMPGIFGRVGAGVGQVTMGLKTMSATPAIAVLGLLATLFNKVTESLGKSEESMGKASTALAAFSGVGVMVQKVFDKLAEGLAWLATKLGKFAEKLGLVTEEMKESKAISEEELQLARERRNFIYEEADAQKQLAELKNKIAQKDKYDAKQRQQMLQKSIELEGGLAKKRAEFAQREYELIKRKNAQSESSAEDLQKEAEAYKAMQQAQADYYLTTTKLQAQASALAIEIKKELAEESANARELAQQIDDIFKKTLQNIAPTKEQLEKMKKSLKEVAEEDEKVVVAPLTATQKKLADLMKQGYSFADAQKKVAAETAASYAGAAATISGAFGNAFGNIADLLGEYAEENEKAKAMQKAFAMAGILANQAQAIAAGVRGVAEAVAAGAGVPFPANIAAIATGVSSVLSIIGSVTAGIVQAKQVLSDADKYATGGIVGGNSYTGDKMVAHVNSGEMILNKRQQAQLFEVANSGINAANYEAMAAAMKNAVLQLPAPTMVYSEFKDFEKQTSTIKEIASI